MASFGLRVVLAVLVDSGGSALMDMERWMYGDG